MLRRLKIKFIVINMLIITAMLCTIFGMLFTFTKSNLEQESISTIERITSAPMQLGHPNEPHQAYPFSYFLVYLGNRGDILAISSNTTLEESYVLSNVQAALSTEKSSGILEVSSLRFLLKATPKETLLVFMDISHEQTTLQNLAKNSVILSLLAFFAFLGISFLLAHWAVKPVDTAWKQQKQFVSDASHELKTPLTVIMTNAELLQCPDYPEEKRKQFSDSIFTMSKQIQHLVEQMLELARTDQIQSQIFAQVDWSSLVTDAILPFEPVFFDKDLVLTYQITPGILVRGIEVQLRQVTEILLDNAQKYSNSDGKTIVFLAPSGRKKCLLTVANEGPQITPEQLSNLFKRFYRADESRTRTGSFGLGLSIAENIVQQHHGRIWAESKNGINCFFVELPLQ